MDIHKNARRTLRSREALVQHVALGMRLKAAAESFQLSAKTAAKWVRVLINHRQPRFGFVNRKGGRTI